MIELETYGIWQKTILVAKKKISVESMETLRNRLSVIWQCVEDLDGGWKSRFKWIGRICEED